MLPNNEQQKMIPAKEEEKSAITKAQEKFRAQVTCPVTLQVFNEPARLDCKGEHLLEEEMAIELLKTKKKCPCCRGAVSSYTKDRNSKQHVDLYFELYPFPGREEEQYATAISHTSTAASSSSSSSSSTLSTQHIYSQLSVDSKMSSPEALEIKNIFQEENPIYMPTLALGVGPGRIHGEHPGQPLIKVLLIGDADQGKSRFCLSLADSEFTSSFITTIGIDFKTFKTDQYKFQVWDTAGQERFNTITSSYFRNASLILFFGDYSRWLPYVLQQVPDTYLQAFSLRYHLTNGIGARLDFDDVDVSQGIIPALPAHINQPVSATDVYLIGRQLLINLAKVLPVAEHAVGIVNLNQPPPVLPQQKRCCK